MKEIKIEIPEGYEIDINKSSLTDGNIVFKKKENTLPTTNKEAVKFLPEICYYIDNRGEITKTVNYRKDPSTIATKELAEALETTTSFLIDGTYTVTYEADTIELVKHFNSIYKKEIRKIAIEQLRLLTMVAAE